MRSFPKLISVIRRNGYVVKMLIVLAVAAMAFTCMKFSSVETMNQYVTEGVSQITASSEHFGGPKETIPVSQRKLDSEIRYAAFGSSTTWGSELKDRSKEAYVWRLSDFDEDRGKNFAIKANGPEYPSSCVSSIIGNDEFDVIVLEYFMMQETGLHVLSARLRERFPRAIIVILRIWSPDRIWRNGNRVEKVPTWAQDNGFANNYVHDEEFKKAFLAKAGDGWDFFPAGKKKIKWQEEVASNVGAYILTQPWTNVAGGPFGWLDIADKFLAEDSFHQGGDGGHVWIANEVKAIVDKVGVPKDRKLGQFSEIDQCGNWFESGKISDDLKRSSNGSVVKIQNTKNKYALEFDFDNVGTGNSWIEVQNKNNKEMKLSIGYMAQEPSPSNYPKMDVDLSSGQKFFIDTEVPDSYDGKQAHVSRYLELGFIQPHETLRIFFSPKEKTEWPFRLIQIMMTHADNDTVK